MQKNVIFCFLIVIFTFIKGAKIKDEDGLLNDQNKSGLLGKRKAENVDSLMMRAKKLNFEYCNVIKFLSKKILKKNEIKEIIIEDRYRMCFFAGREQYNQEKMLNFVINMISNTFLHCSKNLGTKRQITRDLAVFL